MGQAGGMPAFVRSRPILGEISCKAESRTQTAKYRLWINVRLERTKEWGRCSQTIWLRGGRGLVWYTGLAWLS
jgi:hypothetical protein